MSLSNLFELSRRSFRTIEAAMNVAGQNIANAGNENYARRRVTMMSDSNISRGLFQFTANYTPTGGGVSIQTYERLRDGLLASASWESRGGLGFAEENHRIASALENLFPTQEGSLNNQLNDFWNSWSDLSDNPTEPGLRTALRGRAATLATTLNRLDNDITLLAEDTTNELSAGVDRVNTILNQIAELNTVVSHAENAGSPDYAAEDARDQLVQELSDLVPIRVQPEHKTGYTITIDGKVAIQNSWSEQFSLDTSASPPTMTFAQSGLTYSPDPAEGGKLGAWLHSVQNTLPNARVALDEIANALVTEVNALHTTGYGLDGGTGRNFFNPAGVTASSINLSADVLADANTIAASGDALAPGDNAIALAIAGLRTAKVLGGGTRTIDNFATGMLTDIGEQAAQALIRAESQSLIVSNLEAMERGVSGVSIDEEMSNLIELQQSYAATARVLTTAQEVMDTLLRL